MEIKDTHKKVQELISDGERRLKILSAMEIKVVANSPYVKNVLEFLRQHPSCYNEASASIAAQKDPLSKIEKSIEYLKILNRSQS